MTSPEREAAVQRMAEKMFRARAGLGAEACALIAAEEIGNALFRRDELWRIALDSIGIEVDPPVNQGWSQVCPEEKPEG